MGVHLFTYGSLMFDAVWRAVMGRMKDAEPGTLRGYAIYRVRGETYPGVVPDDSAEAVVRGCVYRDLDAPILERLDRFEGDPYRRVPVTVEVDGGKTTPCEAYVVRPSFVHILSRQPWSADWFETYGLQPFLSTYRGFRSI